MDSKHLKTKAIYYWIRKFCEQNTSNQESRHIDEFSKYSSKRLSRRYWLTNAMEVYSVANSYIEKKKYNVNILLCIYINIENHNIDDIQEWSNAFLKKEWTPPELYLLKIPISNSFVNQPRRSDNFSKIFHRDVYYNVLNKDVYGQGFVCLYI